MRNGLSLFSDYVVELNAQARENDVEALLNWAVGSLSDILGFDSAWYGWADVAPEGVEIHASSTLDLPEGYFDFWTGIADQDLLAAQILSDPERVATYNRAGGVHTDGMQKLSDAFGLKTMATAMRMREARSASLFLSAYRSGSAARSWSQEEQEFLRCAVDQISNAASLAAVNDPGAGDAATIFLNGDGVAIVGLNNMQERFGQLWSRASGDRIPRCLSEFVDQPGEHLLIDRGLVVTCENTRAQNGLALRRLTLRPLRRYDLLTPREREVARYLASGKSHKETARALGVAPSTVRNQTQSIYAKLEVGNRAGLASAMNAEA